MDAYEQEQADKQMRERAVGTIREAQAEWFINEAKRCRALGMPIACCDEWPECTHVLAWVEANPLAAEETT
jgi:hypothetical protein